jgi:hypothetical protein
MAWPNHLKGKIFILSNATVFASFLLSPPRHHRRLRRRREAKKKENFCRNENERNLSRSGFYYISLSGRK